MLELYGILSFMFSALYCLVITIFLYLLPGFALLQLFFLNRTLSIGELVGLSGGLSLSIYPILLLFSYLLGFSAGPFLAWIPGIAGLIICAVRYIRLQSGSTAVVPIKLGISEQYNTILWCIVLATVIYVRLIPIHVMASPAWGDSVHHTMIVQLILDHWGIFQSWEPYAPMSTFTYHFGYHIAIACWSWVSQMSASQSVLAGGQMINVLAVCSLYPIAVKLAGGKQRAGIGAMLVAGLLTQMPAYYVNWGRYTQLTAQVILPVFLWLLDEWLVSLERPKRIYLPIIALVSIGLTLTHYRIVVTAICAGIAWTLWGGWANRGNYKEWTFRVGWLFITMLLVGIALIPWFLLIRNGHLLIASSMISSVPVDAAANQNELTTWQSLSLYYPNLIWQLALVSCLLGLWKHRHLSLCLLLWVGLAFFSASPFLLGVRGTGLVTNFLLILGAYIPIAIALGWMFSWVTDILLQYGYQRIVFITTIVLVIFGWNNQRRIVDPFYQLIEPSDLKVFEWIRQNTPSTAKFLVNGFLTYSDSLVVGSDAGWWLPLFTHLPITVPPILYVLEAHPKSIDSASFRDLLIEVRDSHGEQMVFRNILCRENITHIFLGQKQGSSGFGAAALVPKNWLQGNSDFHLLYQEGEAQVWEFGRSKCLSEESYDEVSLTRSIDFEKNQAIWVDDDFTSPQIVFFRDKFDIEHRLENSELHIFADTRYEVWLDGVWQSRGPARFSKERHEYDVLKLGPIEPGQHLLSVLVQWAPNTRRSESGTPHLMAHIQGSEKNQFIKVVTRTDTTWKVLESNAWRKDSASVHSWNLLGPTELLDFRQLSKNWTIANFPEAAWQNAMAVPLHEKIAYSPRSIPHLVEYPFVPEIIDVGMLSPGRTIIQLEPQTQTTALTVEVQSSVIVTIESLIDLVTQQLIPMSMDNIQLKWMHKENGHPDLYSTSIALSKGQHILSLSQIPITTGLTFALSNQNLRFATPEFTQSNHAGRRLLLAEPVTFSETAQIKQDKQNDTFDILVNRPPSYIVLDLGRVVHGRLYANVEGPVGTIVDVGWDERLFPDSLRPLPHPGSLHPEWNQVDSWILDGTERQLTTIDARTGRYILLAIWGRQPVQLHNLRIYEEHFPVYQRGRFHSSDPMLNRIWQIGVETTYISMQDAYADAWRERGQWWGDAYVVDHVNQVAFGDTLLLRRGLLFLAESFHNKQPTALAPNGEGVHMLDYSMLWAQSLKDYYRLTHDKEFVQQVYPYLNALLTFLSQKQNASTGLIDIPKGHWSTTALIDWAGSNSRFGQSTALNSLYYKTLLDSADLAYALGDEERKQDLQNQAQRLRLQINKYLYKPEVHQYVSTIADNVEITPTTHAQAWPIALEVTNDGDVNLVASQMLSSFRVEIFGMFWALEALARAEKIDIAVKLISEKYGRLVDLGATTWWEGWNDQHNYRGSLSHGWGSSPTWFLTTHLLGAQRTGPNSWQVTPAFSGVQWVDGAIPLKSAELQVSWAIFDCSHKELMINAPIDSDGIVLLPSHTTSIVELDHGKVWPSTTPISKYQIDNANSKLQLRLKGGEHRFQIYSSCADMP